MSIPCVQFLVSKGIKRVMQDNVFYSLRDNAYKIWGYIVVTSLHRSSTFHIEILVNQAAVKLKRENCLMPTIKIKNYLETFNWQMHDNLKKSTNKISISNEPNHKTNVRILSPTFLA